MSKRCVLYKPNPSLRMGHCAIVSADHCVFFNVPRRCGTWIGAPLSESGVSPLVFIAISGFYPESHPDHSIQDKKRAELETAILAVLGWTRLWDVPMGGNELTQDQSILVMAILGEPFNSELVYFLGLCS